MHMITSTDHKSNQMMQDAKAPTARDVIAQDYGQLTRQLNDATPIATTRDYETSLILTRRGGHPINRGGFRFSHLLQCSLTLHSILKSGRCASVPRAVATGSSGDSSL